MTPRGRGWAIAAGLIALAAVAPFGVLAVSAARGRSDLWSHLIAYVLPHAALDTAILLTGVGTIAIVVGTSLAWIVTTRRFPGRRLIDGALLLPLAVPVYIVAYAYLDILHPVGPVQDFIRDLLGYDSPRQFRLPDVRSMAGCTIVLGFVLYPYVYLPVRALFMMQSATLLDAGRTLGLTQWQTFFRVALPLARPAIAVGASLALMEALNDIGASEFMGVRTLTLSIYSTWSARSDVAGATQIALALLAVVVMLVSAESWGRRHLRVVNDAQSPRPIVAERVSTMRGLGILALALTPIAIGFVIPFSYLAYSAAIRLGEQPMPPQILSALVASIGWASLATVITVVAGVVVAYAARVWAFRVPLARLASIGYATPGVVVALGVLPLIVGLDRAIDGVSVGVFGASTGLFVLGSGGAVIYAYVARFLAMPIGGTEAGLAKIPQSIDDASSTLGATTGERLRRVHLPLLRPAILTAALLVFVDCAKELPATLLLRPLGVDTLATLLYGEAVRGTYEDAAIAAVLIVLIGLGPVWALGRLGRNHDVRRSPGPA